jgi:hypothetical protein
MSFIALSVALVVLLVDSAIELAFISSMVGYLHRSGANQYPFELDDGTIVLVNAKPAGLLLNEGHTSNGAAGTALVLICFGGFLVLWLQRRRERKVVPAYQPGKNIPNKAIEPNSKPFWTFLAIHDLHHSVLSPHSRRSGLYLHCHQSNQRTANRPSCRS